MSLCNLIVFRLFLTISRPSVSTDGRFEVRNGTDDLVGHIGSPLFLEAYLAVETDISLANVFTIEAPATGVASNIPIFFVSQIFTRPTVAV